MRILTGIQPSGIPHLGNYFGAMRQVCDLQKKGESFLFIADSLSILISRIRFKGNANDQNSYSLRPMMLPSPKP